ncbi:hypothetical protein CLOM_g2078 [Closterium sp. NIES-68]|nr:hypothetical protein CLOM_g2078 [Closterium sp. NIES-68]
MGELINLFTQCGCDHRDSTRGASGPLLSLSISPYPPLPIRLSPSVSLNPAFFPLPVLSSATVLEGLGLSMGEFIHLYILWGLLEDLSLTMDEFIDLCILCGCDYCDSIRGVGPTTALKLIRQHKNIGEHS